MDPQLEAIRSELASLRAHFGQQSDETLRALHRQSDQLYQIYQGIGCLVFVLVLLPLVLVFLGGGCAMLNFAGAAHAADAELPAMPDHAVEVNYERTIDGDTIEVSGADGVKFKVRLFAIDAWELQSGRSEAFAAASLLALGLEEPGCRVWLEYDEVALQDYWQRDLAWVWTDSPGTPDGPLLLNVVLLHFYDLWTRYPACQSHRYDALLDSIEPLPAPEPAD